MTEAATDLEGLTHRAQRHLEWHRLTDAVLSRCTSDATRRRGVPVEGSLPASRAALQETAEVITLLDHSEALPLDELRDLDSHLKRLSRSGALDGPAIAEIRCTLRCARAVRRFVAARGPAATGLRRICHLDPGLDDLEDVLSGAVELDGTLFDYASPELRKLRTEVANLRARIIARLEQIIDKHHDLLSDRYYTLREDRYVVPVRTDAHERFQGIVHATSDSGASIFVEPSAIINHGNRLKMAQAELHREELRILSELSARISEVRPELEAAVESLCLCDLRQASAKLALTLGASVPELHDGTRLDLRRARHPLLVLEGEEVVANDLALVPAQGLVISGPNAGGKTVLLKTVGLFALMVRAGLPIPSGEGSAMGYFDTVLTDLGDEQSTQHNLSTFSAHVRNLSRILQTSGPSSLVLLDELCGGTDPQEGAALACAVSEHLVGTGSTLLLTTHYEQLKAFALRHANMRSASVGFDLDTMRPSFALQMDVPGASSALSVASRFGISSKITTRAFELMPQQAKDFEALVSELQHQARALRAAREEVDVVAKQTQQLKADAEQRLAKLKVRSQRKLSEEAEQVLAELRDTRQALREAKVQAKSANLATLRTLDKQVQGVGKRLAVGGDLAKSTQEPLDSLPQNSLGQIAEGDLVYVPHLRSEATVLEVEGSRRIRVISGSLKLWVKSNQVRAPHPVKPKSTKTQQLSAAVTSQGRNTDNTVSVRGMRVDDALPMMESFIDRLRMGATRRGYVDHGHGSGALRAAVREHLNTVVSQISEVRPGTREEGGDAVTSFLLER